MSLTRRQMLSLAGASGLLAATGGAAAGTEWADRVNRRSAIPVRRDTRVADHLRGKEAAWRFPVSGLVQGVRLAVKPGIVYAASMYAVNALRADDGSVLWAYRNSNSSSPLFPIFSDDIVYVLGEDNGAMFALSADHGQRLWDFKSPGMFIIGPVLDASAAYLGVSPPSAGPGGQIFALDQQNGRILWHAPALSNLPGSDIPLLATGGTLYTSNGSIIRALDSGNGVEKWRVILSNQMLSDAFLLSKGTVYIGCGGPDTAELLALQASSGQQLWRFLVPEQYFSIDIAGDVVCASGQTGTFWALHAELGTIAWTVRLNNMSQNFLAAGGSVFVSGNASARFGGIVNVGGADGATIVQALSVSDGRVEWQTTGVGVSLSSAPTIAGEWLYVGFNRKSLRSVSVTTGEIKWELPISIVSGPVAHGDMTFAIGATAVTSGGAVSHDGYLYAVHA